MDHTCNQDRIYAVESPHSLDVLDGLDTCCVSDTNTMFVLQDNLLPTTLVFGDDSFVGFLSRLIFDPIPPSLLVLRTAPFLLVAAPKSVILG